MSVVTTLLYTFNESQGGRWINTNVAVADIDTFMFQDVRSDAVYQEVIKPKSEIAVYTGGTDVYTTIYTQSKPMNARIYNGYLYVSYNGIGPSYNVTKVYKYEIVLDGFTVQFASNGGTGSMANQDIPADTPTALSMCTFTREDELSFAGWALSADGEPVYSDGQIVENLADVGETITLYAVWRAVPGFEIRIQYNASENNRLQKDITDIAVMRGTLRAESSIIDPVFIIQGNLAELASANYLTIPIWHRKYFIRDIVSVRSSLVQITAHVDVLSSWEEELLACKGIVHRQENLWNLYLNDGTFRTYQNPEVVTQPFPSGFNSWSFILAVAGSAAAASRSTAPEPEEDLEVVEDEKSR